MRSASKKVAEGKITKLITKLVSDSEALEVARPGRIRNILPACRLNVLEKISIGVEPEVPLKKSIVGAGTDETIPTGEKYLDGKGERF